MGFFKITVLNKTAIKKKKKKILLRLLDVHQWFQKNLKCQ